MVGIGFLGACVVLQGCSREGPGCLPPVGAMAPVGWSHRGGCFLLEVHGGPAGVASRWAQLGSDTGWPTEAHLLPSLPYYFGLEPF